MPGPHPAVAAARVRVRRALAGLEVDSLVLVACSGGADSLALAAATAFVAPRLGLRAGAVVVDHGLQDGSAEVARTAAGQCRDLGLEPVQVVPAQVEETSSGPEADARSARYAVLRARAEELGAAAVLLGHTLDDQAEQVLLGLVRGSGARSLSGMAPSRRLGPSLRLLRPLLGLTREQTLAACAALDLRPWSDPHNDDPRFTRVRVRQALADLDADLGPGVRQALARSADLLRDDADALEEVTRAAYPGLGEQPWEVTRLQELPRAVRTRLWRAAALAAGSPGTDLTAEHLRAVDSLVTDWDGQGPLHLPGGVRAGRGAQGVWIGSAAPAGPATGHNGT
ncbi:tRNA lysidine(34) synthetase TilS [Ornithinimicrobium panacihumi]|uniref:tRNA lysidine(34) synthetase TilS n=1 Tax=Ornithinimicrobium panacihumi TaxID=2008449 RepID=UPI003F8BDCF7